MSHPITWRLTPPGDSAAEDALCVVCATHEVVCIALERDATGHRFPVRFEAGGAPVGLCAACIARMGDALAGWPVVAPDAPDPLERPAASPLVASAPDPAATHPEWKAGHVAPVIHLKPKSPPAAFPLTGDEVRAWPEATAFIRCGERRTLGDCPAPDGGERCADCPVRALAESATFAPTRCGAVFCKHSNAPTSCVLAKGHAGAHADGSD